MSTTKTEAADTAAVKKIETGTKNTAVKKEAVAYVGPDIRNVAVSGTVYIEELPQILKKKIEQIPALKQMIIPISRLAAANTAIAARGTALNNLYHAVQGKLRELEKEEGN